MNSWLVWAGFVVAALLLGWVGYHFTVRMLRFVTAAAAAAVVVFVTRYGVTHPTRAPADLVNAFTRGIDALSAAFLQPLLPGRHIPAPGRIGWLVIIALLVFAYRELEVWAMRWQPPTVDMSRLGDGQPGTQHSGAPGESDDDMTARQRHDQLVTELRFRLPAVELRAPAVLPGGTKPNGLASIAENMGVTGSGLAGAIIRFVGMLWPNPRRYQVRVWIEPSGRPVRGKERATPSTKVTVDLEDPQTGGSIATKTLVAHDLDEAAALVAGYVARHIFMQDPTTPPWCVGSFDGGDLAAMLGAGQQRVLPGSLGDLCSSRHTQINILEKAVSNSHGAGVARYELAQLHDLEGDHVQALWLHAFNREQYPRFYRGRYRLGMSLEMIANPELKPLNKKDADTLTESLRILDGSGVTRAAGPQAEHDIVAGKLSAELRAKLLTAAAHELRECRRQLTLWSVIWATFCHRDERTIRKPYWRLQGRQRFHDGARVAELLVTVRQSLNEEGRGRSRKDRRHAKRAMHITAAITGDSAAINALLKAPKGQGTPNLHEQERQPGAAADSTHWLPWRRRTPSWQAVYNAKAERTRWLPWQRRTPSWQAAYNTACLYAALEGSGRYPKNEMAGRAVISLKRAVNDRGCEMERPWDWISQDPDFSCLKSSAEFNRFLHEQKQQEYPAANPTQALIRFAQDILLRDFSSRLAWPRARGRSLNGQHPDHRQDVQSR